jgi:hypothetical protein
VRAIARSTAAFEQLNEAVGALGNNGAAAEAPVTLSMAVFSELTLSTMKMINQCLHDTCRVYSETIGRAANVLANILRNEIELDLSASSHARFDHSFEGYLRYLFGPKFGEPSRTSGLPHKLREILTMLLPNVGSRAGGLTATDISKVRPPLPHTRTRVHP